MIKWALYSWLYTVVWDRSNKHGVIMNENVARSVNSKGRLSSRLVADRISRHISTPLRLEQLRLSDFVDLVWIRKAFRLDSSRCWLLLLSFVLLELVWWYNKYGGLEKHSVPVQNCYGFIFHIDLIIRSGLSTSLPLKGVFFEKWNFSIRFLDFCLFS
jgi:hypothetical protein